MKKIRLDLNALKVHSFATKAQPTARGTVNAHLDQSGFCSSICHFDLTDVTKSCNPEPVLTSGWHETYGTPLDPQ
jgi:hypothetical protein